MRRKCDPSATTVSAMGGLFRARSAVARRERSSQDHAASPTDDMLRVGSEVTCTITVIRGREREQERRQTMPSSVRPSAATDAASWSRSTNRGTPGSTSGLTPQGYRCSEGEIERVTWSETR
jgi:hypothetical protein